MPFDDSDYPGYIGYDIIANEAMQTGVHCCDIAMHAENIKNNQFLKSALDLLEQRRLIKTPCFDFITDEGDAVIAAQSTLNKFLQQTRRELCEFAITKIQDPNANEIFCLLLAPEIKAAILAEESRDFPVSILLSEELSTECTVAKAEYYRSNEDLLHDFCKKPEVCINYIQYHYLVGNKPNDSLIASKMFIVPTPDSTGMLNIAAMHLKRKIIVISARNGIPFETKDYSNGTKEPIYIGYDGRLHFVELRPHTSVQLENMAKHENSILKKAIYKSIIGITRLQQKREIQPQQLMQIQQFLNQLRINYAEIITTEQTLYEDQGKFMQLLIENLGLSENKSNIQAEYKDDLHGLYSSLLKNQIDWLITTILSDVEEIKSQQRISQKQLLQKIISDKIANIDENTTKQLVNNICGTSDSLVALKTKKMDIFSMAQQVEDFFVVNEYLEPIKQVEDETVSWPEIFKLFVINTFTALLHYFKLILSKISSFITGNLYTDNNAELVLSATNSNLGVVQDLATENTHIHNIHKTNEFTPLLNAKRQRVELISESKLVVKKQQHFSLM